MNGVIALSPQKGLTLSDEKVFEMIQQTAEDAKVARRRTYKIDKKVDKISQCIDDHEVRICNLEERERIEDADAKKKCDDGENCEDGQITITAKDKSKLMQWLKWGLVIGGAVFTLIASFIMGDKVGGGVVP